MNTEQAINNNKKMDFIIEKLINKEMRLSEIPEEFIDNKYLIQKQRETGFRTTCERGYDVLSNSFFVEESITGSYGKIMKSFDNFIHYYEYLDGDIYENSCYRYCDFSLYSAFIKENNIDLNFLKEQISFEKCTIDDYSIDGLKKNKYSKFNDNKKNNNLFVEWKYKVNNCKNCDELYNILSEFKNKHQELVEFPLLLIFDYIFFNMSNSSTLDILVEFIYKYSISEFSNRYYRVDGAYYFTETLCHVYCSTLPIEKYNRTDYVQSTVKKHKKLLKNYFEQLKSGNIKIDKTLYYSQENGLFIEKTIIMSSSERLDPVILRPFVSIEELAKYLNDDFSGCDLSNYYEPLDTSKYHINEKTLLPFNLDGEIVENIKKEYVVEEKLPFRKYYKVTKEFMDENLNVEEMVFSTPFFSDFVHFLKNDLTGADLYCCEGLENVEFIKDIRLSGVKIKGELCDKLNIDTEVIHINEDLLKPFDVTSKNEQNALLVKDQNQKIEKLKNSFENCASFENYEFQRKQIYYVSDLHLMHKIAKSSCKTKEDVEFLIKEYAINIVNDFENLLLIAGDISSDFSIFEMFVKELGNALKRKNISFKKHSIVFVLGNHDLWNFKNRTVEEIVDKYNRIIDDNGMILLHNELLYKDEFYKFNKISYKEINESPIETIAKRLKTARQVIFGTLGFAGLNDKYNANIGLYREVVSREEEIKESNRAELIYDKISPIISEKNVVIVTHNPLSDWSHNKFHKGFVYVGGHTHKKEFYDDGETRIYYDNQIGYTSKKIQLKSFTMEYDYNYFNEYSDGIYEISRNEYTLFHRGVNNSISYSYNDKIFMLKKYGCYCFISQNSKGPLMILNGGQRKKLDNNDLNYYYSNMDKIINVMREPLDKYIKFQEHISEIIKNIGGSGRIHGCIIDIDFENHIYVNPINLSMTGYYATDMVNKLVYPNVELQLEKECPLLYSNYQRLLNPKGTKAITIFSEEKLDNLKPIEYLETDIYSVSFKMTKLKKLESGILSVWNENVLSNGDRFLEK